jgi:hypothetical protein
MSLKLRFSPRLLALPQRKSERGASEEEKPPPELLAEIERPSTRSIAIRELVSSFGAHPAAHPASSRFKKVSFRERPFPDYLGYATLLYTLIQDYRDV